MTIFEVIKKPIVTEKSNRLKEQLIDKKAEIKGKPDGKSKRGVETYTQNSYIFSVALHADKPLIKKAVESLFSVKVKKVHTAVVPGKTKKVGFRIIKTPAWKKAIVTLSEGKIELYEGV